jgi:hypothetical protein
MLEPAAAATCAALDDTCWYTPRHNVVAAAIRELCHAGQPTDTGTVGAHLHQIGQLEAAGGYQTLIAWTADTPTTRSHPNWADRLNLLHHQRRLLAAASEIVEAVYRGAPTTGLLAQAASEAQQIDQTGPSSWEPANLAAVLAGEGPDTTPTILARTDGPCLLYPAKTHAINAEPEAGKTWVALEGCRQQLDGGRHVIYIDFEADPADIVNRLLTLGAPPAAILDRFHYIRPQDPPRPANTSRLTHLATTVAAALIVIDGVTEAMAGAGLSINDNDQIATFYALLPRPLANTGAAVLLIDHVVKNREDQGRWGIGAQHKLAGIDGAVYKLEAVTPFSKNKPGKSRLIVAKDRHGQVRQYATAGHNQCAAIVHYNTQNGMHITLEAPGADSGPFIPTRQMQRITEALNASQTRQLSKRAIRAAVHGDNNIIDLAVEHLLAGGWVKAGPGGRGGIELVRPYTPPADPESTETDEKF